MKRINGILVACTILFSGAQVFADEEYEIDKVNAANDSPASMMEITDSYIASKTWSMGRNVKNGKTFFVSVGAGSIAAQRTSPSYIQSRQNAFDKAMLGAKKEMVQFMETAISSSVESLYSEPGESRQQKEFDEKKKEGLALEFARDGAVAYNNDLAKEVGYESAEVIADKSNVLLKERINQKLQSLGYDPNKPVETLVLRKILTSESFEKVIHTQAKARIVGLQAFKTFESISSGENGEIGVVAIYSDRLGAVANAIYSGSTSGLPKMKPKKPLAEQLPNNAALASTFGVRQVIDDTGNFALLAFSQSAPKTDSSRSLQAAMDKAKLQAMGLIRQYVGEIAFVGEKIEEMESTKTYADGEVITDSEEDYQQHVKTHADKLNISGIYNLKRWSASHPLTGHKIAGVVVAWSVSSNEDAINLKKTMSTAPKKNSGVTPKASNSKTTYYEESDEGDEDAF